MTYRNDLEAAHYRISQLEKELKDAKKKRKKRNRPSWSFRNKNHIKMFAKWFAIIGVLGSMTTGSIFGIVRCNTQCNNREQKFLTICKAISPKNSYGHKVLFIFKRGYCYYYTKEYVKNGVVMSTKHEKSIPINIIYQPENQHLFKKKKITPKPH